jgi:glycosyltransferase involved in cell wall biosynthesis
MRVLLVNKYNFIKGGADKYFLDLAELLAAQPGMEVAKFCMAHPNNLPDVHDKFFVSGFNYDHFRLSNIWKYVSGTFYSRQARRKFAALLDEFEPEIIHIHNIYHHLSPSILAEAKQRNIPVVMHVHDYKLVCPNYKMFTRGQVDESCRGGKYYRCFLNKGFKDSWAKSLLVTLEMYWHHSIWKIYERAVDVYLAPSQFVKDKLVEWSVPEKKLQVLYHFIDTTDIVPSYDLGDYLLYFGRLDKEKGVEVLIRAMARLKSKVKLKIVGSGPERANLKALVLELGLTQRVEFVGPKYGQELEELIAQAYLIVVPSIWYEVFGLVLIEAAAKGKLVIASDIGGIKEAVEASRSALLVPAGNVAELATKIDWSLANPKAVLAFAHEARSFVEQRFTVERHLGGLMEVYNSLIRNS